jgi:arabinose-5-phosphate isomerase
MTSDPISIQSHQILTDAVEILAQRRISELPVVNELHQPVGMIDITDTVALAPASEPEADSTIPFPNNRA